MRPDQTKEYALFVGPDLLLGQRNKMLYALFFLNASISVFLIAE